MNRNTESHFTTLPSVHVKRSRFDRSHGYKTTANFGQLVPFFVEEVLPGDTHSIGLSQVVRMTTPLYPVMDNSFLDYFYFFVPNRLVWEHWNEFMGENTQSKWTQTVQYSIPTVTAPTGGWQEGTIADYVGLPTKTPCTVNALPFRAMALIYNEWFRDENVGMPLQVYKGDSNITGDNLTFDPHVGTNADAIMKGGFPCRSNKIHDYFTSCLPQPQKGEDVMLPVSGMIPIVTDLSPIPNKFGLTQGTALTWFNTNNRGTGDKVNEFSGSALLSTDDGTYAASDPILVDTGAGLAPANLYANLADNITTTINDLRDAFAVQGLLEKFARSGSRYTEILRSCFGVVSEDARLQRSEYLGGKRVPINVTQVLQTSSTDATSPLGQTGAFSCTTDSDYLVNRSFTEHGYIIGFFTARHELTYQQGLHKMWTRSDRFDFYWPAFAHLGEQAVKRSELFHTGDSSQDEQVFGYQERWAEYRYRPSYVTGKFRSNSAGTLDAWHYADYYLYAKFNFKDIAQSYSALNGDTFLVSDGDTTGVKTGYYKVLEDRTISLSDIASNPTKYEYLGYPAGQPVFEENPGDLAGIYFSADWLQQGDGNVQRTLAVDGEPQLIIDIWNMLSTTRPMPVYSVPALLGHF